MKKVIQILNQMIKDNIIDDYVMGGSTALLYYCKNIFQTDDIDIFISLKHTGIIINLEPIYTYLKYNYDAKEYGEYLLINGFPIQFLTTNNPIDKEAFKNAKYITLEGERCKIFEFEYLIALMILLFKPKYKNRLKIIIENEKYNENKLVIILKHHNLLDKYNKIKGKFNEENIWEF